MYSHPSSSTSLRTVFGTFTAFTSYEVYTIKSVMYPHFESVIINCNSKMLFAVSSTHNQKLTLKQPYFSTVPFTPFLTIIPSLKVWGRHCLLPQHLSHPPVSFLPSLFLSCVQTAKARDRQFVCHQASIFYSPLLRVWSGLFSSCSASVSVCGVRFAVQPVRLGNLRFQGLSALSQRVWAHHW